MNGTTSGFRLYTTRDSRYRQLILWAINLSETDDRQFRIHLENLPTPVTIASITRRTLAAYSGQTSLISRSYSTELVGWADTDLTGQIDPSDFTMSFDNATLTMLIFDLDRPDAPIVVDPTSLTHTVFMGTAPADDTFTVASGGAETLDYTIETDAPWIDVQPASGSSSGEADPITVGYHLAGLAPGRHVSVIRILSDDAYNSPQMVTIELTIETARADFDRDGDVDQEDFGHLQACLTGSGVLQDNPACADARVDGDNDVDQTDVMLFLGCMSGANLPPDPSCAN